MASPLVEMSSMYKSDENPTITTTMTNSKSPVRHRKLGHSEWHEPRFPKWVRFFEYGLFGDGTTWIIPSIWMIFICFGFCFNKAANIALEVKAGTFLKASTGGTVSFLVTFLELFLNITEYVMNFRCANYLIQSSYWTNIYDTYTGPGKALTVKEANAGTSILKSLTPASHSPYYNPNNNSNPILPQLL
jgi:hypothetical protein